MHVEDGVRFFALQLFPNVRQLGLAPFPVLVLSELSIRDEASLTDGHRSLGVLAF